MLFFDKYKSNLDYNKIRGYSKYEILQYFDILYVYIYNSLVLQKFVGFNNIIFPIA